MRIRWNPPGVAGQRGARLVARAELPESGHPGAELAWFPTISSISAMRRARGDRRAAIFAVELGGVLQALGSKVELFVRGNAPSRLFDVSLPVI